jgi:hypothetical protein
LKTNILIIGLAALLAAGCASNSIAPMGNDTYMINRGGWPRMNGFAVQSECYRDANQFCTNRGLIMIPVSTTMIDGQVFDHNASSTLVFIAVASTNAPAYKAYQNGNLGVAEYFQPKSQRDTQRQAIIQRNLAISQQQIQNNINFLQQSAAESQRTVDNLELQQASHPFVLPPGQPTLPNIGLMSQPNLMGGLIQQQEPNLPSAWDMPKSSDLQTGNVKLGPDGRMWHEYRTTSGYNYWKLAQ